MRTKKLLALAVVAGATALNVVMAAPAHAGPVDLGGGVCVDAEYASD